MSGLAGGWIPGPKQISQEAIAVVCGAIVAAWVFSQLPSLKQWVAERLPTANIPK